MSKHSRTFSVMCCCIVVSSLLSFAGRGEGHPVIILGSIFVSMGLLLPVFEWIVKGEQHGS